MVCVALFGSDKMVACWQMESNRNASGVVMEIMQRESIDLDGLDGFLVDIGPGSFSGVKVGVTMVKAWGWALEKPIMVVSSFDLIDLHRDVAVGSRTGEVFYRPFDEEAKIVPTLNLPPNTKGYWREKELSDFPIFESEIAAILPGLESVSAFDLVPYYLGMPSVSQPKQKFIMGETFKHD